MGRRRVELGTDGLGPRHRGTGQLGGLGGLPARGQDHRARLAAQPRRRRRARCRRRGRLPGPPPAVAPSRSPRAIRASTSWVAHRQTQPGSTSYAAIRGSASSGRPSASRTEPSTALAIVTRADWSRRRASATLSSAPRSAASRSPCSSSTQARIHRAHCTDWSFRVSRASTSARSETSAASSVRPSSPRRQHLGEQERHGRGTVARPERSAGGAPAHEQCVVETLDGDQRPRGRDQQLGVRRQLVVGRVPHRCHGGGRLRLGLVEATAEAMTERHHRARRGADQSVACASGPGPRPHLVVLAALVGRQGQGSRDLGGQLPGERRLVDGPDQPATGGLVPAEQPLHRRGGQDEPDAVLGGALAEEQALVGDGQRLVEPTRLDEHLGEVRERRQLGGRRRTLRGEHPVRGDRRRLPAHHPRPPSRSSAALSTSPGSATCARWRARLGSGAPRAARAAAACACRSQSYDDRLALVDRGADHRVPEGELLDAGRTHQPASEQLVDGGLAGRRSELGRDGSEVGVEGVAEHRPRPDQRERVLAQGRQLERRPPRRCRWAPRRRPPWPAPPATAGCHPSSRRSSRGPRPGGRGRSAGRPRSGPGERASSTVGERAAERAAPSTASATAPGRAATTSRWGPRGGRRTSDSRSSRESGSAQCASSSTRTSGPAPDNDSATPRNSCQRASGSSGLIGTRSGIASRNTASGMSDSSSVARPVSTSNRRDVGPLDQVLQQPRLADAGLAADQQQPAFARRDGVERGDELRRLTLPAHQVHVASIAPGGSRDRDSPDVRGRRSGQRRTRQAHPIDPRRTR